MTETQTEHTATRITTSPREIIQRMHRLAREDIGAQADLFAPGGVLEWPFATPGVPRRVEGRDEIRHVLTAVAAGLGQGGGASISGLRSFHLHETTDPEIVIVELEVELATPGEPMTLPYVQVFRIRDGEILSFRDYYGPGTAQAVTAALDAAAGQN